MSEQQSETRIDEAVLQRKLLELDVQLRRKQSLWETPKALAMILLAAAAIAAAGRIADLIAPARPQDIAVHFDRPLQIQMVPVSP